MYDFCTFYIIIVRIVYNVNMNIGKKLKELRLAENLTQAQLAEKFNINRVNYTRYETNAVSPDYETLISIADFYNITLDELFERKI